MKKLPIILTLLLAAAWWYTSWYWYTCNIKWFCDNKETLSRSSDILSYDDVIPSESNTISEDEDEIIDPNNSLGAPKLWSSDVLSENGISSTQETFQNDEAQQDNEALSGTWSEETPTEEILSWSWANENAISDIQWEDDESDAVVSLCISPLAWPLSLGATNDAWEMKKLETFLLREFPWEADIIVDGNFGNDDFELVKKLQLKYKEQMLDPWDLEAPTWYVWRTTVSTINSISCN